MSGFSAEYLAKIESGMEVMSGTSSSLDVVEKLLEQAPTPALIKSMVYHLGQCAASIEECRGNEAIEPHDSEGQLERYLTLAQRAGQWAGGGQ